MFGFFAEMARLRHIRRWSLMRNTQPENVQEHSHMVAVIAHGLAVIHNAELGGDIDPGAVAAAALFHDAAEIFTGDLPTPVKYHSPGMRGAYHEIEAQAERRLLGHLPEAIRGAYRPLLLGDGQNPEIRRLVGAADKLAAYIKCIEEGAAGNREFQAAANQTLQKLRELRMPEVNYFLEHFMPAFEVTLDELVKE